MTWEQRFEELWADLTFKSGSREHYEQLKSFIQQEIDKAQQEAIDQLYEKTQLDIKLAREQGRQEGRELTFGNLQEATDLIRREERKKVVEILESLKLGHGPWDGLWKAGHNHALDTAIKKLQ